MSALVTNPAPDFTAPAVLPDNSIGEFKLADQKGRYTLLLFYPLDFSPVCPAEIMAFNARVAEFTERGCDIIGISIDSQFTHQAWRNASTDQGGAGCVLEEEYSLTGTPSGDGYDLDMLVTHLPDPSTCDLGDFESVPCTVTYEGEVDPE